MALCDMQYCASVWHYAMCSTELAYGATRYRGSPLPCARPPSLSRYCYTPKSDTRNRIFSTNCTSKAVSSI
eukprot:3415811-Rhodomonas_salina.1